VDAVEIAFGEYSQLLELFRFYLGLVLETVTFTLGVTGGIVAYVLKERRSRNEVLALSIPGLLCLGMGVGFIRSYFHVVELQERLDTLAGTLGVGLTPHVSTLSGALLGFGGVLALIGVAGVSAISCVRRG
jgi:hypothetical protein